MRPLPLTVTYQDSCHLAHGQKIRSAPRKLLAAVPAWSCARCSYRICAAAARAFTTSFTPAWRCRCSRKRWSTSTPPSARCDRGVESGMHAATRGPGVKKFGQGQRVAHVVEMLDEAYARLEEEDAQMLMVKTAPPFGPFAAVTEPPFCSTIDCTT